MGTASPASAGQAPSASSRRTEPADSAVARFTPEVGGTYELTLTIDYVFSLVERVFRARNGEDVELPRLLTPVMEVGA